MRAQIKMERVRGERKRQKTKRRGEEETEEILAQHRRQPLMSARGVPLGHVGRV